jgi:hypothetical protein
MLFFYKQKHISLLFCDYKHSEIPIFTNLQQFLKRKINYM